MLELSAILVSLLRRFDVEILSESATYEAAITLAPTSHIDIRVGPRAVTRSRVEAEEPELADVT